MSGPSLPVRATQKARQPQALGRRPLTDRPRLARLLTRLGAWVFHREHPVDFDGLDEHMAKVAALEDA